jgi:hypothetical protein
MQGFREEVHTSVVLTVSETVTESFKLEVGGTSEKVVVEAEAQRVNVSDANVGLSLGTREIDLLPQAGRSPINFALLQNGIQYNAGGMSFLSSVNGLRLGSSNQTLDGIDANDPNNPVMLQNTVANNTDSIGEFRMVTSGAKAEYGRNAGGQIEMITRSGGDRWSGNAYEYMRNDDFNANSFFNNSSGTGRSKLIQNVFGASLGGPIIKDKTFIFGNFQGTRIPRQVTVNRTVLTPQAKTGLFRWKDTATGAVQTFDIVGADPRKLGINSNTASTLKLTPDPNNFDIGDGLNTGGYRWNAPANSSTNTFMIRADHNLTSKIRVFYRISWYHYNAIDYANGYTAPFPGSSPGYQPSRTLSNAAGLDWTVSPRMFDEFRYGFTNGFSGYDRPRTGTLVGFNSFTSPTLRSYSSDRENRTQQVTDNFTFIRGKHIFKFGGQVRLVSQWTKDDSSSSGQGIYQDITLARANGDTPPASIGPSTGISSSNRAIFEKLYNDLLGRIDTVTQVYFSDLQKYQPAGSSRVRDFLAREQGYFFQDDWKLLPNLTLNLGLRWEFFGNPRESDGFQGTVDQISAVNAVNHISNLTVKRGRYYTSDWNNFAPRFGFAWSPDKKTAIRGSYGIFYDRLNGWLSDDADGGTPGFSQLVRVNPNITGTTDYRVSDGIPATPQPSSLILQPPNDRSNSIYLFEPNLRTPYVHNFNLSIQRELFRNTVLDVAYVGTFGVKMFKWIDVNQDRVSGDFQQSFQQLQAYRASNTPVPASNTLVKMFGSVNAAINGVGGASTVDEGLLGTAADNVDLNSYSNYAAAGVSDFYLRNYPQFNQVALGGNEGRSNYHALEATLRRQMGSLKVLVNYTFSKNIDNGVEDFYANIDNYNLASNRARSDLDRTHVANWAVTYTLPVGSNSLIGRNMPGWADRLLSGWDLGVLGYWQSGPLFTPDSGRSTFSNDSTSWPNYTGDRNIGEVNRAGIGNGGIYYFSQAQINAFSFPTAGQIGTAGRNTFRGPGYNDLDASLTKKFRIRENHALSFRAEAYNVFNHPCFGTPSASLDSPASFGRISSTQTSARYLQLALRYDF